MSQIVNVVVTIMLNAWANSLKETMLPREFPERFITTLQQTAMSHSLRMHEFIAHACIHDLEWVPDAG